MLGARPAALVAALVATAAALPFAGCSSSSPPGPSCTAYQVPAGTDLMNPQVSFQADVLPLFESSCGLSSSCHADKGGPRIFLGSKTTSTTPAEVIAQIVSVDSIETDLQPMPYVTPGDPSNSFLMHKMDGDQCMFDKQCTGGCGTSMPQGSPVLSVAHRDTVRRWIAQGAKND